MEEKNQRDVALVLHITARHIHSDQKTNVTTVTYAAQFREGVTRVDPSDFILSSPDGASSNIFSVRGSAYNGNSITLLKKVSLNGCLLCLFYRRDR